MYQRVHSGSDENYQGYISMAEITAEIIESIHRFLDTVKKSHRVDAAYLFGSYAKNTSNQWSDIDIAIVSQDFSDDLFDERLRLLKIAAAIDDRIEPRPFNKKCFNPNDPLVNEIHKNGILI
jgi:predicted nucleotidyltransferase